MLHHLTLSSCIGPPQSCHHVMIRMYVTVPAGRIIAHAIAHDNVRPQKQCLLWVPAKRSDWGSPILLLVQAPQPQGTDRVDCLHKAVRGHGLQLCCLSWRGGPHYVAEAIPDWQQRQGTIRQEDLQCRGVGRICLHCSYQTPLLVAPGHCPELRHLTHFGVASVRAHHQLGLDGSAALKLQAGIRAAGLQCACYTHWTAGLCSVRSR